MRPSLNTMDSLQYKGKTVLLRVDLNVPMTQGKVDDATRITRLLPTIEYLQKKQAKIVILSHFGRPKGEFVREMSLAPLADELGKALGGQHVHFALDCIGDSASEAINVLKESEILLLENLRFHKGEEANNPKFTTELASLGDLYINDTFSCSHRKHASIVGLAKALPSAAGLLLQDEIENLERVLESPDRPIAAIVGGAKVSTKLNILHNLVKKVDLLVVGGAMANTFLFAKGHAIGASLYEPDLKEEAIKVMALAEKHGCELFLPTDAVLAKILEKNAPCQIAPIAQINKDQMILDIGPESIHALYEKFMTMKTIVWNGPLGAFEISPFGVGTIALARIVSARSQAQKLVSVGGGGDIVAALGEGGLKDSFSYISTAGGAFLEWLEGKELPGIAALSSAS